MRGAVREEKLPFNKKETQRNIGEKPRSIVAEINRVRTTTRRSRGRPLGLNWWGLGVEGGWRIRSQADGQHGTARVMEFETREVLLQFPSWSQDRGETDDKGKRKKFEYRKKRKEGGRRVGTHWNLRAQGKTAHGFSQQCVP